jgi:predicted CXXCH cytochrome family protein
LKKILVLGCLSIMIVFFIECTGGYQADTNDSRGANYAGSRTCISCHKNVADAYAHNGHFGASAKVDSVYLKNITKMALRDTIKYSHDQQVVVSQQDNDVYQSYYKGDKLLNSQKIDIAFGSAEKAQTYAYWKDSQLYELPGTYLANPKMWTNSPGFPIDHPYFTRVIPSRCFECHASYVQTKQERDGSLLQLKEVYNESSIIYGIDCERCHGPAALHVKFQQENPNVKTAKFITSVTSLSVQQQLDMCGTCHAGDPVRLNSIFNFIPGDTLSKYYLNFSSGSSEPDVHGMQLQLLRLSKCFQKSQLTCNTCHSPHRSQENALNANNTCISCHQQVTHTTKINTAENNCISCHMPLRPSKSLDFNNQAGKNNIQYMLRTHRIAVYP